MLALIALGIVDFVVAAPSKDVDRRVVGPPGTAIEASVPTRAITRGPKAHWFGYYDKFQFDSSGRYVLGMEVNFEDRKPTADDAVRLGMVDLREGDKWIPIGESRAWSWQQGCMLQWLPGSDQEVIYNDRQGDHYVSVIRNVFTGESRVLPRAIYSVSPDGKRAVGTSFARIDDTRPGYGYKGVTDPYADELAPAQDGIYALDLTTGESRLIISIAQIAAIPQQYDTKGKHWFNHLLFNPDGTRFIFLHRAYQEPPKHGGWVTRMFTANPDGSGLHCVADHGMVSHFIWRNPKEILAWSKEPSGTHFHLYEDQRSHVETVGEGILTHDGHCTYSPDGNWILTDGYPAKGRLQPLMLFRPANGAPQNHPSAADVKLVLLGRFYLPEGHTDEFRCDLHPRWSRDGNYVCIDSMHEGGMRQMYLLDVHEAVHPAS
jgi:hypothetical protein